MRKRKKTAVKSNLTERPIKCGACRWYRPQWGECCFGGGWNHYPNPNDDCARGFVLGYWFNT